MRMRCTPQKWMAADQWSVRTCTGHSPDTSDQKRVTDSGLLVDDGLKQPSISLKNKLTLRHATRGGNVGCTSDRQPSA